MRQLLKLNLIAVDRGLNLGRPADILVDPEKHRIALIVLSYGAAPVASVVCTPEAIGDFGESTLTLDHLDSLRIAFNDEQLMAALERGVGLRGRSVITASGARVGTIARIEVDQRGSVVQYHLRRPRFGRLRPTFMIAPSAISQLGADVAVARISRAPDPKARVK